MLDPTAPWIEAPSASDLSICSNIWAHEGQPIREGRTSPSGRVPPVAYRPRSVAANVSELEKAVAADALVSVSYQIPLRPLPAGVKGPAAHAPKPILLRDRASRSGCARGKLPWGTAAHRSGSHIRYRHHMGRIRHRAEAAIRIIERCRCVREKHDPIVAKHRVARCRITAILSRRSRNDDCVDAPIPKDDIGDQCQRRRCSSAS
jgi:hypothetical protein